MRTQRNLIELEQDPLIEDIAISAMHLFSLVKATDAAKVSKYTAASKRINGFIDFVITRLPVKHRLKDIFESIQARDMNCKISEYKAASKNFERGLKASLHSEVKILCILGAIYILEEAANAYKNIPDQDERKNVNLVKINIGIKTLNPFPADVFNSTYTSEPAKFAEFEKIIVQLVPDERVFLTQANIYRVHDVVCKINRMQKIDKDTLDGDSNPNVWADVLNYLQNALFYDLINKWCKLQTASRMSVYHLFCALIMFGYDQRFEATERMFQGTVNYPELSIAKHALLAVLDFNLDSTLQCGYTDLDSESKSAAELDAMDASLYSREDPVTLTFQQHLKRNLREYFTVLDAVNTEYPDYKLEREVPACSPSKYRTSEVKARLFEIKSAAAQPKAGPTAEDAQPKTEQAAEPKAKPVSVPSKLALPTP